MQLVIYKVHKLSGWRARDALGQDKQKAYIINFNPLSTNSDQQQFSPNNIHTLSRDEVMRINQMITREKMP